ncbi:MAG: hypothetical protein U0930_18995 [Pirellulales bacterium]
MLTLHFVERIVGGLVQNGWSRAFQSTWHMIAAVPPAVGILWMNPYGGDYIPYLIRAIRMPRPLVTEWRPLWNNYAPVLSMVAFVLAFFLFRLWPETSKITATNARRGQSAICHMAFTTYPTWFDFCCGLDRLRTVVRRTEAGKSLVSLCNRRPDWVVRGCQLATVATLFFAGYHHVWMPSLPSTPLYSTSCYPTEAVEYLRQNQFQGNVLTTFQDGAYVSWQLYPQVKVSLDSRYEVAFDDELVQQHVNFGKARGSEWWQVLQSYPTDLALIPTSAPVCSYLDQLKSDSQTSGSEVAGLSQGWQVVYRDDSYLILASDSCADRLPFVDRTNQPLPHRVDQVFSNAASHWALQKPQ